MEQTDKIRAQAEDLFLETGEPGERIADPDVVVLLLDGFAPLVEISHYDSAFPSHRLASTGSELWWNGGVRTERLLGILPRSMIVSHGRSLQPPES